MRRTRARRHLPVLLVALLAIGLMPGTGQARWRKASWPIATGVTLHRFRDRSVPLTAFVLEIDPSHAGALDVGTPYATLPGVTQTSAMGIKHGALAAINGDFGKSRPEHVFAQDGVLWQTGTRTAGSFAMAADESQAYIGRPKAVVTATGPGGEFAIDMWNNGQPAAGQIAGYSPEGGSIEEPPTSACAVRLTSPGGFVWAAEKKGIKRTYVVAAEQCSDAAMPEEGGVVLATPRSKSNPVRTLISALNVGDSVTIKWSVGFAGVLDAIGGRPLLVQSGANVAPTGCGSVCYLNPRSGVGLAADGRVFFVVVDGRQKSTGWSAGMTLADFADFFVQRLGAVSALNFDGGGSATLWVSVDGPYCFKDLPTGCIVNRANSVLDFKERRVSSALLLLPGADTYPSAEPVPTGP